MLPSGPMANDRREGPKDVERMTRDQMVAEFGGPGVENPAIIDLISLDSATGAVVLTMIERRPWGVAAQQLRQIEEKINRYMGYALDGFLVQHYPQYAGKPVTIRLQCAEAPHDEATRFVDAAAHAIRQHGMELVLDIRPPEPAS